MTFTERALRWLYLCAGALTTYCATVSARHDAPWYAAGLLTTTGLLVTAAARDYLDADERRVAAVQAERAARARSLEDERRMRDDADTLAARRGPLSPLHILGAGADGEEGQRNARRTVLRLLLARADRTRLTPDEAALLRQHVDTEIRYADTARAVAAGNLRHVKALVPALEQAQAAIRRVHSVLGSLTQGATGRTYHQAITDALDGTEQPASEENNTA